ncbi:Cadherin, partial [Halocaridina rubra]
MLYHGNVTEKSTSGLEVISLQAEDYDDQSEGTNAKIMYVIEKNAINEITGQAIFKIEGDKGVLRTSVCCLDREKTQSYLLQVAAVDGGGLKGRTASVSIEVLDVNDNPPRFEKEEWIAEVEESDGSYLPLQPILTVSVYDEDKVNHFTYKIVEYSGTGTDKFDIYSNPDGTGSLMVKQQLDYEDPQQRVGFKFQIQVSDTGDDRTSNQYHVAKSWVRLKLLDVNDNDPEFLEAHKQVIISENAKVGTSLVTMIASDPDNGGRSKVSYGIDKSSDENEHFSVDSNGVVKIQRLLDREANPCHTIRIIASDDGIPVKSVAATLTVNVTDVNDNAPTFLSQYYSVLMENRPPKKVAEIFASDNDDSLLNHGPPFHFWLDPSASMTIKNSFRVDNIPKGLTEDGMAVVFSLRSFDREVQKEYLVPIVIRDSGTPAMIGTSTLTVTIGDENDNKMQSGTKDILLYSYMGKAKETEIGRVYVNDLDDWDLSDKNFTWAKSSHSNFYLDENSGMIKVIHTSIETSYNLDFYVFDRKHLQKVRTTVNLKVKHVSDQAIRNAGSVRLVNISEKEFVSQWDHFFNKSVTSKARKFCDIIGKLFELEIEKVDLFSIQRNKKYQQRVIDLFFAVRNSMPLSSVKVNGVVLRNKKYIEEQIGITILTVGINDCTQETTNWESSCTNTHNYLQDHYLIDENRTSFIGVQMQVRDKYFCGSKDFSTEDSCRPNLCFNGGRCVQGKSDYYCNCPREYTGPRCQILTRTFVGSGFAWFPPLDVCESNNISVEFLTKYSEGMILYNGPMAALDYDAITDFIALEIDNGLLKLLINLGSGTLQLRLNATYAVSDGKWHQVDIYWNKENVHMILDHCKDVQLFSPEDKDNMSGCFATVTIASQSKDLNVNSPLQVGGLAYPLPSSDSLNWDYFPEGKHFQGCIKNLMVNSKFYDFAHPAFHNNTVVGCSSVDEVCGNISAFGGCGLNGKCSVFQTQPICECNPGWRGAHCDEATIPSYFENQSYVKYALLFQSSSFSVDIQLRLRTWEENGELFRIVNRDSEQHSILEIKKSHLCFRYSTKLSRTQESQLCLNSVIISDGMWHFVKVRRQGMAVILSLDEGAGRKFNKSISLSYLYRFTKSGASNMYIGGHVQYSALNLFDVQNDFRFSCLDDLRLDGKELPLPPSLTANRWARAISFQNVVAHCISQNQCLVANCTAPFVCKNLWMRHECSCPNGSVLSEDKISCVDEDECLYNPCANGGTCYNKVPFYLCQCPRGYGGDRCHLLQDFHSFQLDSTVLLLITASLLASFGKLIILNRNTCTCGKTSDPTQSNSEEEIRGMDGVSVNEGQVTILDLTTLSVPSVSKLVNGRALTQYNE